MWSSSLGLSALVGLVPLDVGAPNTSTNGAFLLPIVIVVLVIMVLVLVFLRSKRKHK